MADLTVGEVWKRREVLERKGATLLGKLVFEFSRLDMNLGLCVVWVDGGSRIESLTKQVSDWAFSRRLDYLEAAVSRILPIDSPGRGAYLEWIGRARVVRTTRNELVHGRWGIDGAGNRLVNVVGLPTSPDQREVGYTLGELAALVEEMKKLQHGLSKLVRRWPL